MKATEIREVGWQAIT